MTFASMMAFMSGYVNIRPQLYKNNCKKKKKNCCFILVKLFIAIPDVYLQRCGA